MKHIRISRTLFLTAVTTFFAGTSWAGGFSINENSAVDLGRANAGRVTHIQDASAAFGNPALMTRFEHFTASNTGSYITGNASFEDQGSVDVLGQSLGGDTDSFFDSALVPALHAVYPVSERLAFGFSLNAPYGLSSTYEDGWAGRYQGLGSELLTVNANPSVAFGINDQLSIGGGINVQYARATLSSALDLGAACFAQIGPDTCVPLGLSPQSADGELEVDGDDFSFGYNVGAAFSPIKDVTFGVHFRSRIRHDIEGSAEFTVPDAALILTSSGAFTDSDGTAELPLPGFIEAGAQWQASENVSLYANFIRTFWSDLEELRIDFDNPAQPDAVEELNFQNANRYAVGVDVKLGSDWEVRTGFSFDEGAAVAETRTVRIPDNDRFIGAVGASYKGLKTWRFDAAYNRFELQDTEFSRVGPASDLVVGEIQASVNIFAIGVTKTF